MKVLVFENDESHIETLREVLVAPDYEVVIESQGRNVGYHLEQGVPELVISNFDLLHGGIELVNSLLAELKSPFPYILFITNDQSEKFAMDCLGPIPGDFISSPIRAEELKARVAVAERAIALQDHLLAQKDIAPDVAMYDTLTNLLNRQAVYERALAELNRAQRDKQPLCICLLEITNISQIELGFGEKVAQQAVRFVARAIRANLRMYDLVGRWADARFLILLPALPTKYTRNVIERVYGAIQSVRIRLENENLLDVDIAAGYSCLNIEDPEPLYQLIDNASESLKIAEDMSEPVKVQGYSQW